MAKKITLYQDGQEPGKQTPVEKTFEEWVIILLVELRQAIDRLSEATSNKKGGKP